MYKFDNGFVTLESLVESAVSYVRYIPWPVGRIRHRERRKVLMSEDLGHPGEA